MQVVVVAAPVRFVSGETGVLVASLRAATLGQALNKLYGGPGFGIVVVDQEGKSLVHPDPATAREMRSMLSLPEVGEVLGGASGSRATATVSAGGVEQLTAYAPLSDLGWGVLVSQPVAAAFGPARRQLIIEWALLATTVALTSAFAWFLSGRLSRLYELQGVATRKARQAAEQLSRQLGFTSAITRNLGDGVYAFDRAGRLTFINPAAERMLGWKEPELLGRPIHDFIVAPAGTQPGAAGDGTAGARRSSWTWPARASASRPTTPSSPGATGA